MKTNRMTKVVALTAALLALSAPITAGAQCGDQGNWTPLNFPYSGGALDVPLLLTDGRVMVQYVGNGPGSHPYQDWWALTPDPLHHACYTGGNPTCNAQWNELASLYNVWQPPTYYQYGPYGFASAVLASGHVLIQGGEEDPPYTSGNVWTPLGAIFDPTEGTQGTWSQLAPPAGWQYIGDAQSVVLPDGTYMVAECGSGPCSADPARQQAIYKESTQQWTVVGYPGNGKDDANSEEGYTLLPSGLVLTLNIGAAPESQTFYSVIKTWSDVGDTPQSLVGSEPADGEIGPAILLDNGNVFATGAATLSSPPNLVLTQSAIYTPSMPVNERWSSGPTFPVGVYNNPIGMGDEPAVLLPDGNVLMAASDGAQYYFLEYTGASSFCQLNNVPSNLVTTMESTVKMLLLPNQQVFITTSRGDYYLYSPQGTQVSSAQPSITSVNNGNDTLTRGDTYPIKGTLFNGLSQANMFGDDYQAATNYPLVRITDSLGHVYYARTHDHSNMGVAVQGNVTTSFDVPATLATGNASLVVVANGIASTAVSVTIN